MTNVQGAPTTLGMMHFASLPPTEGGRLLRGRVIPSGGELGDLGSGRAVLMSGAVARIARHADGRSAATALYAAPALLRPSLIGGRWIALGTASCVPEADFEERYRPLGQELAEAQAVLQRAWLDVVLFEPVHARIAYLMLLMSSAHPSKRLVQIAYPRIAGVCGVTERSVGRALGQWLNEGVVSRSERGYAIEDRPRLASFLGNSGQDLDLFRMKAERERWIRPIS